jgi:hypothetical protein
MLDVANARRRFTCFSFGFFLYVWPAAGVNKNGLGFFFITSEGRLIGSVSLDWYYSSYRSDHSVKIIFLIRKIRNKVNTTHVMWPLFYFFNIKQNTSFLIKKNKLLLLHHTVLFK